ncbi:MAG: NYN domain-containing protein [Thermoanaerobaculia bacterium]
MSPWWLRPPEESPEPRPATATGGPAAEAETSTPMYRSEPEPPSSIADLVRLSPEPAVDRIEAAEPDPAADSGADDGEETGEPAANRSEEGERPGRRRRRGGRRRRRAGAPADSETRVEAPRTNGGREWEEDEEDDEANDDYENLAREILGSLAATNAPTAAAAAVAAAERKIAMFCDLENIALGVRDSEVRRFDINLVLERLLEKGKIIVKRAYADWERYSDYKKAFHEAAIELIDIPQRHYSGKNSADIKMVVDAMDLCYAKEHLDTFVVLSGDSDFSPLVSKLKENNKYVIGIGVKNSSSNLLIDNCDEFLYYEDVWRDREKGPELEGLTKKKAEAFTLLIDSVLALQRENKDVLWGSLIKQTMQRKKPSFNEGYYGYSTFTELLQDAQKSHIINLRKDDRAGTWVVTGFAKRR